MDDTYKKSLAVVFMGLKGKSAHEALNHLIDEEIEKKKEVVQSIPKSFDEAGRQFMVSAGYINGLNTIKTIIENIIKESPSLEDQARARLSEAKLSEDL
jgi:peptidoglycan hydrolase CwlO-like protein